MFLDEPHSHPRYYGELLKSYEGRLFSSDHKLEPYYASGVCMLLVEKCLNSRPDWREVRPYKHQLLMLLKESVSDRRMPKLNSNGISNYSLNIVKTLRDPERGTEELGKAIELLRSSLARFRAQNGGRLNDSERNPPHRLRAFTELLIQVLHSNDPPRPAPDFAKSATPDTEGRGRIRFFDNVRKYGFIGASNGFDVFVHESEMLAVPYHLRVEGVEVTFRVARNPRSPSQLMAREVKLIPREGLKQRSPTTG